MREGATRKLHDRREDDPPAPLELWQLHGATDDLRALSIETSFGHALGLELDHELILLHLQPSLEVLVGYADRLYAALVQQGWQDVDLLATEKECP
jgi:hypothetical protein